MDDPASTPAAAPTRAVCPAHADVPAVGTCARCGRFVCAACRDDASDICPDCVSEGLAQIPASTGRAQWATRFLTLVLVADVGAGLVAVLWLTGAGSTGAFEIVELLEILFGLMMTVVFIGSVIAFLRWMHLAARQAIALSIDIGATPGWAVGWWFVPFANLVKPYRIARAMLSGLGGEELVRKANLSVWWAMWIVSNVASNMEVRTNLSEGLEVPVPAGFVLASSITGAIAAYLAIGVVRTLQEALDGRRAAGARTW